MPLFQSLFVHLYSLRPAPLHPFRGRGLEGFDAVEREGMARRLQTAYWDITIYFSEPEGGDVLPAAVYQWTEVVTTHMPQLSKPQAAVLALWSVGMVLARSCALSAVSEFLAKGLERKPNTVRQQLREWCYEANAKRADPPGSAGRDVFCAVVGVGLELVGRHAVGLSSGCDNVRPTVCGAGRQRRVPGLCDSGGVDGLTGHREACMARRMAADAAPGAGGRAPPLLCDCHGGSGLVCALVISAHRALGVASSVTDQYGRDVSARREFPLSAPSRVGAPSPARNGSGWAPRFRGRAGVSIARCWRGGTRAIAIPGCCSPISRPVRGRHVGTD